MCPIGDDRLKPNCSNPKKIKPVRISQKISYLYQYPTAEAAPLKQKVEYWYQD